MPKTRYKALPSSVMNPQFSTYPGEVGTVSFYAAAYNNVDLVGDVVVHGAFDKWLADAQSKGARIPVHYAHGGLTSTDATMVIGYVDAKDIVSDNFGLKFEKAVLDLDNPTAAVCYRNIKTGALQGASFSYETIHEMPGKNGTNLLMELVLKEAGPCPFGINPLAGGFEAKSLRCSMCNKFGARTGSCEHCGTARITVLGDGNDGDGTDLEGSEDDVLDEYKGLMRQIQARHDVAQMQAVLEAERRRQSIEPMLRAMEAVL